MSTLSLRKPSKCVGLIRPEKHDKARHKANNRQDDSMPTPKRMHPPSWA